MNYPGNQVTARLGQQRRPQPGEHPSGPIGPFGPIRETFADGGDGLSGDDGYTLPSRGRRARHAGPGDAAEPGTGRGYGNAPVPPQGYGNGPVPPQGYGNGPVPPQGYGNRPVPPQGYGNRPVPPQGYGNRPVPPQGYGTDPAPRRGRPRHAGRGYDDRAGRQGGPGNSTAAGADPRRGPAHGHPPRAGDPGSRYQQDQFAAWNGAPGASQESAQPLMASAPTWADTGEADLPPADGGGVALAERLGGQGAREQRGDFSDYALPSVTGHRALPDRRDRLDRYSAGEAEELATGLAGLTALAVEAPVIADTPAPGRTAEPKTMRPAQSGSPARRSRAAAAKERKAARRKGRNRRRVLLAGICVPAVVAVAALAYLHHPAAKAGMSEAAALAPDTAASATSSPKAQGQWQHIGTRAEDQTPLTLGQLFPAQFPAAGSNTTRTAQATSTKCPQAIFGKALQAAVRKHSCSQVMRASYLSTAHKLMGTIGVLNLGTAADASAVGKVTGSGEFIAQLTAHSGPTHNLAKGTGLEEAEVKGHYLIMTWVEFSTLHAPKTSAQRAQLRTFSTDLINQTVNVSLTSRMVTGSPQMP
jgi:hypothetical protein